MLEIQDIEKYKSDKIINLDEALSIINEHKEKGKTVGLCNGGFDLLHPGHVKHFESAKNLCDILFVSVTSDKFVSSRKGSERPIFTDKLRAYMIANLDCVDYVFISNFKKGVEVINIIKPTYYIKGPDFITKNTPGINEERAAIANVNGEIKYTNDPKLSTTKIIDYIKDLDIEKILLVIDRDGTLILNNDFPGKNDTWKEELEFNRLIIDLIVYIKTKYDTTCIVVSNQTGVARRFFTIKRVEEINDFINEELKKNGINIKTWKYCPDADLTFHQAHPEYYIDPNYIKEKTKRKPSPDMVLDGLNEIEKKLDDFTKVIVLGDRSEDGELANNINGNFIDVNEKSLNQLIIEFESFFKNSNSSS